MTSAATQDLKKSARRGDSTGQCQSPSGSLDELLSILIRADRPLTEREIALRTDVSPADTASALESMCDIGVLRRLNTVIETYTARFL